jgi:DNA-binding CsgD family transcriptional regulator
VARRALSRRYRTEVTYGRFLVRPYALAGSRWEVAVGASCAAVIGTAFVAELLTPDDVVAAVVLPPLLLAIWLLSSRLAAVLSILAISWFALAIALEPANRLTLAVVGTVTLATALTARLYATALARLLSKYRHLRPTLPSQATPPTLGEIEGLTHGIRSLTRRELEVASLGAQGYTTPEIARRLHIGDRTVETHLSGVYAKLRIGSRNELIRMAARLGSPATPARS